jgi:hypothetical protein
MQTFSRLVARWIPTNIQCRIIEKLEGTEINQYALNFGYVTKKSRLLN